MNPSPSLSWRSAHSGNGPTLGVGCGVGGGGGGVGCGVGGGGGGVGCGVGGCVGGGVGCGVGGCVGGGVGGCVAGAEGRGVGPGPNVGPGPTVGNGPLVGRPGRKGGSPGASGSVNGAGVGPPGTPVGVAPGVGVVPGTTDSSASGDIEGCWLLKPASTACVGEGYRSNTAMGASGARKTRQPMKANATTAAAPEAAIAARRATSARQHLIPRKAPRGCQRDPGRPSPARPLP